MLIEQLCRGLDQQVRDLSGIEGSKLAMSIHAGTL
jgi:hypothetical protein